MEVAIEILLVLVLVLLNGFFVAAEYASVKLRASQLEEDGDDRDSRVKDARHVIDNLETFISATQVGITLASLAIGWLGEPLLAKLLEPLFYFFGLSPAVLHSVSFALGFMVLTTIHIVLGEQIPKTLAINYEKAVALATSGPLIWYYRIFRPIVWLLHKIVSLTLRLFGFSDTIDDSGHTRDELLGAIMEGAKRGVVGHKESAIIESLFELRETSVREVMVHRSSVIALDLELDPREVLKIVETEGFSRLPVFRGAMDEITGVLHVKDLLPYMSQLERLSVPSVNGDKEFYSILTRAVRPALFVSETQMLSSVLLEFQQSRVHMAIAVSEHGGVEGIVTLEDILEELVGEIRDESDVNEERDVIEVGASVYVIPTITISDFNERFEKRFPELEESAEYQTISGYVQKAAGRIPNMGDVIEKGGLIFTVTRKERNQLQQIKIEAASGDTAAQAIAGAEERAI